MQGPVWVGNTIRYTATFSNTVGAAPPVAADVVFTVRKPDGTRVVAPTAAGAAPGEFHADFSADMHGEWYVRAECGGTVPTAKEDTFRVAASKVLP